MMKIAVIGYSGSGKSILARRLGRHRNAKVLHLDTIHHLPGWKERELKSEKKIVADFLDSHSSWVIDGNYTKLSFERRMREADRIILLEFNRISSLFRILKRYRVYRGRRRPDMAPGCGEKIDGAFLWWILYAGRTKEKRAEFQAVKKMYPDKTVVLRNQRQIDRFTERMKKDSALNGFHKIKKLADKTEESVMNRKKYVK